ncbi:MAG: ATP-binding protein, partial [Acidobacteriota bacterium]
RIARLPQLLEVEVPSPDFTAREHFLHWFEKRHGVDVELWGDEGEVAELSAGLSIHALDQLLKGAAHGGERLERDHVVAKVEEFIQSQLGEDVVEIKKPEHRLTDVIGFAELKEFLDTELIPRFQTRGPAALPGAAVAGPIGGGKTFIFEAVAAELDMVVVVLKNLRSQWFGQTDVIFERLRRVLEALAKVVIFVDEADTQFGGVGAGTHATERRLTGKIQQMMSDPKLRGKVFWLLMTARIHLLSPDIRRPGRVGDLILPVLDPEGDDRRAFLRWVLGAVTDGDLEDGHLDRLDTATPGYSSAAFAALRGQLKAQVALAEEQGRELDIDGILDVVADMIPADIGETRRYQTLQALINCTRRRLLPSS